MKRIIFATALLFSALFLPISITLIFGILGIFFLGAIPETILIFFISDLIFSAPQDRFLNNVLIMTILGIVFSLTKVFSDEFLFKKEKYDF